MHIRGIRGAITADDNTREAILGASRLLLAEMAGRNGVEADEIAAVLFTCTGDLTAAFPAEAARLMGWSAVPLMSAREMEITGALERCIRVLILWNTPRSQAEVAHVYLREAVALRPDLLRREGGRRQGSP